MGHVSRIASLLPALGAVAPAFFAFASMLIIPGVMLFYLLPMLPFLNFLTGIITWMVSLLQAVVAIPIIAIAHLTPSGEGLPSASARGAYTMMLQIFLRPVMMIFGLIAGIMVSYIGIWMVNDGYASILKTIAFAGGNFASLLVGLVSVPMVYMIICMQVINRSFTLIHVLPDKVTRWLAGGNVEQLGSEMAGAEKDAKSTAQGGMDSRAKGMGDSSKAFKDGAKAREEEAKKKRTDNFSG